MNFYLQVPKTYSTAYGYISSYYYRDNGSPLYEARGSIDASEFTKNYPLSCSKYVGNSDDQTAFMEMSQEGICDLLDCLKQFIRTERLRYSFNEFGFAKY